ncbi:MAG: TIGR04086 family membrane protein [Clostridia bacterium]|nr:TIGR04086 family membrane protein [Clostridia bacterium]
MNRKRKLEPQNKYLKPLIVGTLTAIIVTVSIILISALFFVIRDMPKTAAMPIALVASGLGSFVGAVAAAKTMREQGIIIGGLTGFTVFALSLIISLFASDGPLTAFTVIKFIVMTLSGALGGILGVNSAAKRKMI